MLHTVLIGLHAALGGVSFVAGVVALRRGSLFLVHFWTLAGMLTFLAIAIAVEWGGLGTVERVLFTAFLVLGLYMVLRAVQASRARPAPATKDRDRARSYIGHMGFNLIALFDAFVVVLVLDLGGPVWLIVTTGVAVAVAGHFWLRNAQADQNLATTRS